MKLFSKMIFCIFLLITSCKPAGEKVVNISIGAILSPVSISSSLDPEIGEVEINPTPTSVTLTVKNNSSNQINNMIFDLGNQQSYFKFALGSSNVDGFRKSPGGNGTCAQSLPAGESCTYVIDFIPSKIGKINVPMTFSYINLIEAQTKSLTFTGLVGDPASLDIVGGVTNYNLGIFEQTEPNPQKFLDIEIKNFGGLAAQNVKYKLSSNIDNSFEILDNKCPARIEVNGTCKIRIGYTQKNIQYNDPQTIYSTRLGIDYLKSAKGSSSRLSSTFRFTSTTIEGKFKENFNIIDFPTIVAGNKTTKLVKISNVGYRQGKLISMIFKNQAGSLITTCTAPTSGHLLECGKSLPNFPFQIEDTNGCFNNFTNGINGASAGGDCFFTFTYWPSTTFLPGTQLTSSYFNDVTIDLVYDSNWKNNVNIVTKEKMFEIKSNFIAAGKLKVESIEFDKVLQLDTAPLVGNDKIYTTDLKRVALIKKPQFKKQVTIKFKNIGEDKVNFVSIKSDYYDFTESKFKTKIITDLGADLNPYYNSVKHTNCVSLNKDDTCILIFSLAPLAQLDPSDNDLLMYDFFGPLKHKSFLAEYNDGSSFEDNSSSTGLLKRTIETRIMATLVAKGYLILQEQSIDFPDMANGSSFKKKLTFENIGTGRISAIAKIPLKSIDYDATKSDNWPLEIKDENPISADLDCHDMLYSSLAALPVNPDTSLSPRKYLDPGETCELTVESKLPETARLIESNYTAVSTFNRLFTGDINNTSEIWDRSTFELNKFIVAFDYHDGDAISNPLGFQSKSNEVEFNSKFYSPGYLAFIEPEPITSAVFRRPRIDYPEITSDFPVVGRKQLSKSIPITLYESSTFSNLTHGFVKSINAKTHVSSLGLTDTQDLLHGGSYPLGSVVQFKFKLINPGGRVASSFQLIEDAPSGVEAISVTPVLPTSIGTSASVPVEFQFSPTVASGGAKDYKRCYTLKYKPGLADGSFREHRFCVMATALSNAPNITIEAKDIIVTKTGNTISEDDTQSFSNIPTNVNSVSATTLSFSAVKNGGVYAKKLIRITNVGANPAGKLNFYYMNSITNANTPAATEIILSSSGLANPCAIAPSSTTISASGQPGDYCELFISFNPTSSSAAVLRRYLGIVYEINTNQYLSKTIPIDFMALTPAILEVPFTSIPTIDISNITDWTIPIPEARNASYGLNIGNYSTAATPNHHLLTTLPTTKSFSNIEIRNRSELKASFLNLVDDPSTVPVETLSADQWNRVYPKVDSPDVKIYANRYCFFGDDEDDAAVPADEKGFKSSSTNSCRFNFEFSGYRTLTSCSLPSTSTQTLGQKIDTNCHPYVFPLEHYDYKRSSLTGKITFHFAGFIEPNRSETAGAKTENVTATNTGANGRVSFSWTPVAPLNPAWGAIQRYRVYFDKSFNNLRDDRIFNLTPPPSMSYIETSNASINNIVINNLSPSNYYYFKVVAIRSYNGMNYVSNTNIPILTVVIPTLDYIYNPNTFTLIDKRYGDTPGTLAEANTYCNSRSYSLINVSGISVSKKLINSESFEYILSNPSHSYYDKNDDPPKPGGYLDIGVGSTAHWLSDPPYNLSGVISNYDNDLFSGFPDSETEYSGEDSANKITFVKTCIDQPSCNSLNKIVGGDDIDARTDFANYRSPTATYGHPRCSAVIRCPTNTTKLITDGTCEKP